MEKLRGIRGRFRGGSAPTNQSAGPVRFPTVVVSVVVVFRSARRVGPLGSSGPPWWGDTDGDGGSELLDGDLPVGSSLPSVRELWCSGSPVLVCVSSSPLGGSVRPPCPWSRHGRRRVRSDPQEGGGLVEPLPLVSSSWMNRCVAQLIPGCGSALGLWIPGQAGWVLLCCYCGPPPHRRWAVGPVAWNPGPRPLWSWGPVPWA